MAHEHMSKPLLKGPLSAPFDHVCLDERGL